MCRAKRYVGTFTGSLLTASKFDDETLKRCLSGSVRSSNRTSNDLYGMVNPYTTVKAVLTLVKANQLLVKEVTTSVKCQLQVFES